MTLVWHISRIVENYAAGCFLVGRPGRFALEAAMAGERDARGRFIGRKGPSRSERLAVQKRPVRKDGWSEEKQARFFAELANGCNIKAACAEAGMSTQGAYRARERDASFRAGWRRAMAQGYAKLELQMLERALIGEKRLRGALATVADDAHALDLLGRYPARTAELLYRTHRAEAIDYDLSIDDDPDGEKARASIEARIEKWRKHLDRELARK